MCRFLPRRLGDISAPAVCSSAGANPRGKRNSNDRRFGSPAILCKASWGSIVVRNKRLSRLVMLRSAHIASSVSTSSGSKNTSDRDLSRARSRSQVMFDAWKNCKSRLACSLASAVPSFVLESEQASNVSSSAKRPSASACP